MTHDLETAARSALEAAIHNAEMDHNVSLDGIREAIAALVAALAAFDLRDQGKMMKPKPGAPAGGYPIDADRLRRDAEARQRGENIDGSPRRETVPLDPAAIRRAALEEAADDIDSDGYEYSMKGMDERAEWCHQTAAAIRALAAPKSNSQE